MLLLLISKQEIRLGSALPGHCRHPSQWAGGTFAAQRENAGLCLTANGYQRLRQLDTQGMVFPYNVVLPPALEIAALRDVCVEGIERLHECKCASTAHIGARVTGQLRLSLACATPQCMQPRELALTGRQSAWQAHLTIAHPRCSSIPAPPQSPLLHESIALSMPLVLVLHVMHQSSGTIPNQSPETCSFCTLCRDLQVLHLQADMYSDTEEACFEMLRSLEQCAHLRVLSLAWAMQVRRDAIRSSDPVVVCGRSLAGLQLHSCLLRRFQAHH